MNEEEKDDLQRIKEKLRQTEEASLGFSAKGYIGRVKYGISFIVFFLATALAVAINSSGDNGGFILLLVCLLWVVIIWYILQVIKRLHDVGITGWLSCILFIPVVNLFLEIWLLCKKGVPAPQNKYKA